MIAWSAHRREVKRKAKLSLFGGTMTKGIIMSILLMLFFSIAMSFLPIIMPEQIATQSPMAILRSFLPEKLNTDFWTLLAVSGALYLLLTAPLTVGMHRFFLMAFRGEKPKFSVAFSPFANFSEVLGSCALTLLVALASIVVSTVILLIPMFSLFIVPFPLSFVAFIPLFIAAVLLALIISAPFSLAQFVYAEDSTRGPWKSFILAIKRCRGVKTELLVFNLSFFAWKFLALTTAPFGSILLNPYLLMSYAGFYDTIDMCK